MTTKLRTKTVCQAVTLFTLLSTLTWAGFWVIVLRQPTLGETTTVYDAIVQLGGVPTSAYTASRQLASAGTAPNLVVSAPFENQVDRNRTCQQVPGVTTYCFKPNPSTTRGEAREIGRLAAENGWSNILVFATGREHVERARMLIKRCYSGQLSVNFHPIRETVRTYAFQALYQTAGWGKALVLNNC